MTPETLARMVLQQNRYIRVEAQRIGDVLREIYARAPKASVTVFLAGGTGGGDNAVSAESYWVTA